jgi:hypothetical protein
MQPVNFENHDLENGWPVGDHLGPYMAPNQSMGEVNETKINTEQPTYKLEKVTFDIKCVIFYEI